MDEISYDDAMQELETILADMKDNKILIDQLDQKVSRARLLLDLCQKKLRNIEDKVKGETEDA